VGFSEGFDDYSTARVRLEMTGGEAVATVHTAAAEVGQGLITVQQQICRTELGVERVVVHPTNTAVGSSGSTSASRQTYVTGGAVKAACEAVRAVVLARAALFLERPAAELGGELLRHRLPAAQPRLRVALDHLAPRPGTPRPATVRGAEGSLVRLRHQRRRPQRGQRAELHRTRGR
jgi:CO/xanthine dehydrogenase Mo-binding subunit